MQEFLSKLLRRLRLVDWYSVASSLLKTLKKDEPEVDPKYLAIKPKVLSDANMLRGLAALRTVLAFIPPAHLAADVLTLGDTGFKIWKALALRKEYDHLEFPPVGYNTALFSIRNNQVLKSCFPDLSDKDFLFSIYNDFSFITDPQVLGIKYPQVPGDYVAQVCSKNLSLLGVSIEGIEQKIISYGQAPEVDANLREALEALKGIFPALRDWSLLSSEKFDEVLDIIDAIV